MITVQNLDYFENSVIVVEPQLSPRARVQPNRSKPFRVPPFDKTAGHNKENGSQDIVRTGVIDALTNTSVDWRTPETIASVANLPVSVVKDALQGLLEEGVVRRPVGYRVNEESLYRLSSRNYTFGERTRLLRVLLTRG